MHPCHNSVQFSITPILLDANNPAHHFARPSMSSIPGLFDFTSPSVACLYRLLIDSIGLDCHWNDLCGIFSHLYSASFSSYDVWIGPVFGKLCTMSIVRSNNLQKERIVCEGSRISFTSDIRTHLWPLRCSSRFVDEENATARWIKRTINNLPYLGFWRVAKRRGERLITSRLWKGKPEREEASKSVGLSQDYHLCSRDKSDAVGAVDYYVQ